MAEGNGNGTYNGPSQIVMPVTPPSSDEVRARAAEVFAFGEDRMRTLASELVSRLQFAQLHGLTFKGQRDLYKVLGYLGQIGARDYGERYARGGIAGRLVDVFPNATWRGQMDVVEDKDPHDDTAFEKAWKALDKRHQIQAKLHRVDKLSLLTSYAVLLIGAPGDLKKELPKARKPGSLLYLAPFSGGGGPTTRRAQQQQSTTFDADVSIYELDTDSESERFGLPIYYTLKRTDLTGGEQSVVHWTRIIHVAENVLWDEVYGLPALERVWNLLDDLDKVTGGGAEAFWLRANQGMHLNVDPNMSVPDAKLSIEALKEQAEEYKHQLTRWLRTRGVEATPLGSDVANFLSPADAILTQIAGAKGIPKRILTGSEMGELASSQDRDNWKDQVNGRQTQYAGPYIVRPLVDRLIAYGYLPAPAKGVDEYEVTWPHMQVMTDQEKADGALKWAQTNQTMGEVVFTNDEVREHWQGFEPLADKDRQPITMPTRVSVTGQEGDPNAVLPAGEKGKQPAVVPGKVPFGKKPVLAPKAAPVVKAAEAWPEGIPDTPATRELLAVLEAAIQCNNTEVIDEILGLSHGG